MTACARLELLKFRDKPLGYLQRLTGGGRERIGNLHDGRFVGNGEPGGFTDPDGLVALFINKAFGIQFLFFVQKEFNVDPAYFLEIT